MPAEIVGTVALNRKLRKLLAMFSHDDAVKLLMFGGLVFERGAKKRITEQGLVDTGNLRTSTTAEPLVTERKPAVTAGPRGVEYAAIHEFGGVTHPTVTPKMRGFAWYKYKETGDTMWRAIALTRKTHLTVRIPARPYMRPTFDEDKDLAIAAIRAAALVKIRKLTSV